MQTPLLSQTFTHRFHVTRQRFVSGSHRVKSQVSPCVSVRVPKLTVSVLRCAGNTGGLVLWPLSCLSAPQAAAALQPRVSQPVLNLHDKEACVRSAPRASTLPGGFFTERLLGGGQAGQGPFRSRHLSVHSDPHPEVLLRREMCPSN